MFSDNRWQFSEVQHDFYDIYNIYILCEIFENGEAILKYLVYIYEASMAVEKLLDSLYQL